MTVSAVRPWRTALQRERCLPSSVTGPVLFVAGVTTVGLDLPKSGHWAPAAIIGFVLRFRVPSGDRGTGDRETDVGFDVAVRADVD
jgi:hypothetical protein